MFFLVGSSSGLCCQLSAPCPKPKHAPVLTDINRSTRDQWEISRDAITFRKKLGAGNFGEVWYGKFYATSNSSKEQNVEFSNL